MDTIKQIKENIDSKFLSENGTLQIISSENYMNVLKENQSKIIEVDRDYIQRFVKIGSYLKSTEKNIFNIFERIINDEFSGNLLDVSQYVVGGEISSMNRINIIRDIKEKTNWQLEELKDFFKKNESLILQNGFVQLTNKNYEPTLLKLNQHIISYQSLVISSFKMIKSLSEDDMITFYELYEVFDKLGIFDTQWQKSMLEKLGDLTSSLDEVTESLNNVNSTIKDGLDNLSQEIFDMSTDITFGLDMVSLDIQSLDS